MPPWLWGTNTESSRRWAEDQRLSNTHDSENLHNSHTTVENTMGIRDWPTTTTTVTATMEEGGGKSEKSPVLPSPVTHRNSVSITSGRKRQVRTSRNAGLGLLWGHMKRRIVVTATALSGTSSVPTSVQVDSIAGSVRGPPLHQTEEGVGSQDAVDEIIVDRIWGDEYKTSTADSEHGETSPVNHKGSHGGVTGSSEGGSSLVHHGGFWAYWRLLAFLRWTVWPTLFNFFATRFDDKAVEAHYQLEDWDVRKTSALWTSLFLVLNWTLSLVTAPKPLDLLDSIFLCGISTAATFPVVLLILFNVPQHYPLLYQCYLVCATWCWSIYQLLFIYLCGYYGSHSYFSCEGRDFIAMLYYATAMQTLALFGLRLKRISAFIGCAVWLCMCFGLILPYHSKFARNVVNIMLFNIFLLVSHYYREISERRLYTLREQLKVQYKATQKAQVNERKAADSKRRLTSYVFHEVRVPLNTALLAVQNMEASGTVAKTQEIEFMALEGSLNMMSKVLNDVLDFNRLDSGRFESVSRPYSFHQTMRSLLVPLKLATNARGLELITHLDPEVDRIARRAAYEALDENEEEIQRHFVDEPELDGMVVGDEIRLRQVITNLASNACKFTPSGGQVSISTRLVLPATPLDASRGRVSDEKERTDGEGEELEAGGPDLLSDAHLRRHNCQMEKEKKRKDWIVVRIEIKDTGYGIKPTDMVESKLFSAFNQTEQGRQQGGKGTGLGLALVRQIVKLSGGRLGVRSKVGAGSTFWFEIPLGVGAKTLEVPDPTSSTNGLAFESRPMTPHLRNPNHEMYPAQRIPASRTTSAMTSLMEQGGRVELVLGDNDSSTIPTRQIGDISTGTQYDILPTPPEERNDPSLDKSSSATALPTATERPTFVRMPSPITFAQGRNGLLYPSPGGSSTYSSHSRHSIITPQADGLEVLVCDDDPLTRTLMSRMLTRMGCVVQTAENGLQAIESILGLERATPSSDASGNLGPILEQEVDGSISDHERFAVIFLDNQMPIMSGLKAVAKLRDLGRKDFVVGITGNALLQDQEEYMEAGVDHVLTKPVLERNLKAMIQMAEERRKKLPQSKLQTPEE